MTATFGEFLVSRLNERSFTGPDGRERFRHLLEVRYSAAVSPQTLWNWLHDKRVPSLGHLVAILDLLDVYGTERDAAIRLAAGTPLVEPQPPQKREGESDV